MMGKEKVQKKLTQGADKNVLDGCVATIYEAVEVY